MATIGQTTYVATMKLRTKRNLKRVKLAVGMIFALLGYVATALDLVDRIGQ
jgi:hypothetical protein